VYSFGVVLLELLMGLPAREVVVMLFDDREFFDRMQEYKDPRAGDWPKKVVKVLAAVAKVRDPLAARTSAVPHVQ
jgi:hypothetical protein